MAYVVVVLTCEHASQTLQVITLRLTSAHTVGKKKKALGGIVVWIVLMWF
jgi:hypothetical protein